MRKWIVNGCRLLLAVVLVFSGYVKAIDPLGTQYKIQEYLSAMGLAGMVPDLLTLLASVGLSALEFSLGVFLLFAVRRRQCSRVALVLMVLMTLLTLWLTLTNPVADCGCFGDALKLTNWQTFLKNVVLLGAAVVVARRPLQMTRFISRTNQWIVLNYTVVFILLSALWSLYRLPNFDFRPYHVGADIRKGMAIPEGAKQPKFETTFILEKDGEQREFGLEDYPDSTWTFIDSKTVQTEEGYVPPIHDFSITEIATGEDITGQVVGEKGYTFLLVAPYIEYADDSNFGDIDRIWEYAEDNGYKFYCLTASNGKGIARWRDMTGAEYPFCSADATTLKTIIRSNPGLVLLKDGVVIRKWSHNALPTAAEMSQRLEKAAIGQLPEDRVSVKIMQIVLWFILPLLFLTIADRLWAWTRWVKIGNRRRKHRAEVASDCAQEETDNE